MAIISVDFLKTVDHKLSVGRINTDVTTDFIYAPHFSAIYANAGDELFAALERDIRADRFAVQLPVTIETPKKNGMTRPGSILEPSARLLYQILADQLADTCELQVDRSRVFSNIVLDSDPNFKMFRASSDCYADFISTAEDLANRHACVLQADIASFFERIYHHNLINFLVSAGADPSNVVRPLEQLLSSFTQKDSHGLIQGLFPSDLLGNIYLCPLDAEFEIQGVSSCRYVDDIFVFFECEKDAKKFLTTICAHLRREGLNLNEAKTSIVDSDQIVHEETEVQKLFIEARREVVTQLPSLDNRGYGFTGEWTFLDVIDNDRLLNLHAINRLYEARNHFREKTEAIDKYCLPVLAAAKSDVALKDAFRGILERPHLAREYCQYLSAFLDKEKLVKELSKRIESTALIYESQRMWLIACLLQLKEDTNHGSDECLRLLRQREFGASVRALAALYVGAHGTASQRRILRQQYQNEESSYVRSAILYAAKYFPKNERDTCIRSWGAHSTTNSLIASVVKKLTS